MEADAGKWVRKSCTAYKILEVSSTERTLAIEDVELPGGEIGIGRPSVGHRADLRVLVKSSGGRIRTRGYARILALSSHLSGR